MKEFVGIGRERYGNVMTKAKVCVFAGKTGEKEYSILKEHASQGCNIAFMDKNKELGRMIKEELEKVYHVPVFFFHGDIGSEEDRDIFLTTVKEMFGGTDYIICKNE